MSKRVFFLSLVAFLSLGTCLGAWACTYVVPDDGSIQDILDNESGSVTICLKPGVYSDFKISTSRNPHLAAVEIIPYQGNGGDIVIQAQGNPFAVIEIWGRGPDNKIQVHLEGLKITGNEAYGIHGKFTNLSLKNVEIYGITGGAIWLEDHSSVNGINISVHDIIKGYPSAAVYLTNADTVRFSNIKVYANYTVSRSFAGLGVNNANAVSITDSEFYENPGTGIFLRSINQTVLENIRTHNNEKHGLSAVNPGLAQVSNIRAWENGGDGIHISGRTTLNFQGGEAYSNSDTGISLVQLDGAQQNISNLKAYENKRGMAIGLGVTDSDPLEAVLDGLEIYNNHCEPCPGPGGGLWLAISRGQRSVILRNSQIYGNTSTEGGGVLLSIKGNNKVAFYNVTIRDNMASYCGGLDLEMDMAKNKNGCIAFNKVIFLRNSAKNGGGICVGSGTYGKEPSLRFNQCIFEGNRADNGAAGYFAGPKNLINVISGGWIKDNSPLNAGASGTSALYFESPAVISTNFSGNQVDYNIYFARSRSKPNPVIEAANSYWDGVTDEDTIHEKIYDHRDNSGKGTVYVMPAWNAPHESENPGLYNTCVDTEATVKLPPPTVAKADGNSGISGDPISTATGEVYFSATDFFLGGPLPLAFTRYYASFLELNGKTGTRQSSLGPNWTHNFALKVEIDNNTANIIYFGGKVIKFTKKGGKWELSSTEPVIYQLISSDSEYKLMDPSLDLIFTFDEEGRLTKVEDRNGNAHYLTYSNGKLSEVSDVLGRKLTFTYDDNGRLKEIQDQTGRKVRYGYERSAGLCLSTVQDPRGGTTTYLYSLKNGISCLLRERVLPEGNSPYTQKFDDYGRVTDQSDSLGYTTSIHYDEPSDSKTKVVDPLGNSFIHTYQNNSTALSSYTDQDNETVSIEYDENRRRTAVTDRLGDTTTVTYHAESGKPASYTNALGHTVSYTYELQTQEGFTFYNLTRIDYPDGTYVSMTYDEHGNVLTFTDQAGKTWSYTYNSRGQILTVTNPLGGVTSFSYNADGTLASLTDPFGHTTTFEYDDLKRPVKVTHPDGTFRAYTYDENDNLLTIRDERGKVTTFTYDRNNNLKTITDPLGHTTNLAYDGNDRLVSITDPLGKTYTYAYNSLGLLAGITNPLGKTTTYGYNAHRWLTSITDPAGKTTRLSYNKEGMLSSLINPLGHTWNFDTNALERVTSITDPLGQVQSYTYDAMERLSSSTTPLSHTTSYTYDPRGLLTQVFLSGRVSASYQRSDLGFVTMVTDPRGNDWTMDYDQGGRLTSRTDPLGRSYLYEYDFRNRLSRVTMPGGGALEITRDEAGNIIREHYSDGTDLQYTYDDVGRITAANGLSLSYDERGDITNSNGIAITRDELGRIKTVSLAEGKTVTYTYDDRGLVSHLEDWAGGWMALSYDDAGRLVSLERSNGITTTYTYDDAGRLTSLTETRGGEVLSSIKLTRDAEGKVTSAERNVPLLPQLASQTQTFSYNEANEIEGFNYDAMGRLIQDDQRTYTWDLAGRLTSYTEGGAEIRFTYDALGQMTSRTRGRVTREFVWNYALGIPSISVIKKGGQDVRYYVHLPSGFLLYSLEAENNSRHFYHYDEMGTTLFLSNDSGTVTDKYGVTPYGILAAREGNTDNPFIFIGAYGVMQEEDTGLYYIRARFYAANIGRFISKEQFLNFDPKNLNPYLYALNNPLLYVDLTGLRPKKSEGYGLNEFLNGVLPLIGKALEKSGEYPRVAAGIKKAGDPITVITSLYSVWGKLKKINRKLRKINRRKNFLYKWKVLMDATSDLREVINDLTIDIAIGLEAPEIAIADTFAGGGITAYYKVFAKPLPNIWFVSPREFDIELNKRIQRIKREALLGRHIVNAGEYLGEKVFDLAPNVITKVVEWQGDISFKIYRMRQQVEYKVWNWCKSWFKGK